MIDPLLSLSFNLHAHKGTYALLVGSGISRSSGIPTGWEVTLDLTNKLAHLQKEDCGGDAAKWYASKFGKDPDYAELLSAISPTSAAQQQLLKGYFEPSEKEREEGEKLPTLAHKAIAQLVASGHIRVIVTTNFDRLLEAAFEAQGIAPIVIASPDAAKGAPPLAHSKCTVIKVHGDYLDHRIKNSPTALAKYDPAMNKLLDQVFDEYGLIICGWSSEYDVALCKALERCKSRRYPMYWTGLSEPKGNAKKMIAVHKAHYIKIDGADTFFTALVEKVVALEEFDRPHPVSIQAAIVTLKKYLTEDRYRIQLHDFLIAEATQAGSAMDKAILQTANTVPDKVSVHKHMKQLEANCEKLIHLFATGSYFARLEHVRPFFDAFNMVVMKAQSTGGYSIWIQMKRYPALLLVYATGIAAISSENYVLLSEIASRPTLIKNDYDKGVPAPIRIYTHNVMDRDQSRQLIEGRERGYTPLSDYLYELLREPLRPLISDDNAYERAFDSFEYLWCLLHVDAEIQRGVTDPWTPFGSFSWRCRHSEDWLKHEIKKVIEVSDKNWQPLKAGLFGGSLERLKAAQDTAKPGLERISNSMW